MYTLIAKPNLSFDEAVEKTTKALAEEGFGILTKIDVKETMKSKLGIERKPYVILGACNPPLANAAITAEPDIGALLPCNVIVREEESGEIVVSIMNPKAAMSMIENPKIKSVAEQAGEKLERVRKNLES